MAKKQIVTALQIAKDAGVSQPTVSLVMNERWQEHGISPQTRKRVLSVAQRLGYIPNRLAMGLKSKKTNLIGLVVHTVAHPLYAALTGKIITRLADKGLETIIVVMEDFASVKELEALYSHRPEGTIIGPFYNASESSFLQKMVSHGHALIGHGGHTALPFDHVSYNRSRIIEIAVGHLREEGHQRIGGVIGQSNPVLEKLWGELFRPKGLKEALTIRYGSYESGFTFAGELSLGKDRPTAFFFQDETFAIGFLAGVMRRGLRVPDDIAFVVGSRAGMGEYMPVAFTNVYPDQDEMVDSIMRLLFQRLHSESVEEPEQVWLEPRLVVGDSSRRGS